MRHVENITPTRPPLVNASVGPLHADRARSRAIPLANPPLKRRIRGAEWWNYCGEIHILTANAPVQSPWSPPFKQRICGADWWNYCGEIPPPSKDAYVGQNGGNIAVRLIFSPRMLP